MKRYAVVAAVTAILTVALALTSVAQGIVANHTSVAQFANVPVSVIQQIQSGYRLFYGHTSHGSQIVTGMYMLQDENAQYGVNSGDGSLEIAEYGSDLGHYGDTAWAEVTRQALSQPGNGINVVVWSWCGGVSDNSVEGINAYLDKMADLESDYPSVKFIYMTGHLDGSGPTGNLYLRNNQIRDYCTAHGKVLFDFADIESYDPAGVWYPDETDACAWCADWCASHTCSVCGDCAHSHCFNCYQKGKAFWWLLAKMIGWGSGPCCVGVRGNVDMVGVTDLSDLSLLIDYMTPPSGPALPCVDEANCDGQGIVDLSDVSYLIDFLTPPSGPSFPACP